MSNHNDRELSLYMAQILDQTDRRADTVELMNHVLDLNPQLTSEERNLLSASYKSVISVHRNGLRILSAISQHEEGVATQHRIEQIKIIRQTIIDDLEKSCNELINMINEKLLPVTQDAEARIFYSKLLADYYRYMCEARTDDKRKEYAEEAKKCYESALDIAKTELRPFKPASLGLILNYSVFLQEILGDTEAALDLAQKTYSECTPLIEENSDNSYSEATMILQLLRDNILLWSDNQAK